MADEKFQTSANWWESARSVRFESGESQSSSSGLTNIGNFAWQQQQQHDMVDMKPRSSMDSMSSVSRSSAVVFHDTHQKLPPSDSATSSNNPNLHMMDLGLSSQAMDWNQASLLRGEKASESSFRSIPQENLSASNTNFQQETGIRLSHQQAQRRSEKLFSAESSTNEFEEANRGFSLDQTQFSPQYSSGDSNVTSQGLPSSFQMDSSALYGNISTLQGLSGPESNQSQQGPFENRPMNFGYSSSYGLNSNELMPSWSKVPQFLRVSPPKQSTTNQLHFTNNAPFWNASEPSIKDARSSFFPSLQPPFSTLNFYVQSKNISKVRESGAVVKKSGSEQAPKRPRNETPSPLSAFKVRKEKMGDRITALQQLVSPFGKTDTASVLSEAIEYIKFLHEQVTALSTPYLKSGVPTQHQQQSRLKATLALHRVRSCQILSVKKSCNEVELNQLCTVQGSFLSMCQNSGESKEGEGTKQELRSRGLCLVPVSSTFPVTHEPTADIWTPTFGGTYR